MSQEASQTTRWYRKEPWAGMCAIALAVFMIAAIVPPMLRIPMMGLAGVLMAISVVLLIKQHH